MPGFQPSEGGRALEIMSWPFELAGKLTSRRGSDFQNVNSCGHRKGGGHWLPRMALSPQVWVTVIWLSWASLLQRSISGCTVSTWGSLPLRTGTSTWLSPFSEWLRSYRESTSARSQVMGWPGRVGEGPNQLLPWRPTEAPEGQNL